MSTLVPLWRKATRSNTSGGDCVEVARLDGNIALRDSKDPDGPKVILSHERFTRFVEAVRTQ